MRRWPSFLAGISQGTTSQNTLDMTGPFTYGPVAAAHKITAAAEKGKAMERLTEEEKGMLHKIVVNQYTGGGFKRATWIDKVCRNAADKALLAALCEKGLVETGLGGTVAGDPYDACWLTPNGWAVYEGSTVSPKGSDGQVD